MNRSIKIYNIRFYILLTCSYLFLSTSSEAIILPIPAVEQALNLNCWAAACEMTLVYWTKPTTQKAITLWATDGANQANGLYGVNKECNMILLHFGSLPNGFMVNWFTAENCDKEINERYNPFFCGMEDKADPTNRHIVLAVGFTPAKQLYYNDPKDGDLHNEAYVYFRDGVKWKWIQTLWITPAHPEIGIFDGVASPYGPTQFIYPGSSSQYYSYFVNAPGSNAWVTQWQWSMVFNHSSGTYNIPTGNISSNTLNSTCNFSSFTLPSGYLWQYNGNGDICGNVTVRVLDSDGYWHDNSTFLQYTPQNPYPLYVWYAYQTVLTAQPEVKAHSTIDLCYDQLSAGSINFKAGSTINIMNNVTISNGCAVNFVVDPSLQYPPADECEGVQEWDPNQHWTEYTLGDLRTNDDRLWECINVGFSYYEPSGPYGHYGWSEIGPCN